jgi:hypothetical protein
LPDSRSDLGEFYAVQWTRTRLCRLLRDYFRSSRGEGAQAPRVRVGTDLMFYYDPADRLARVMPDLYILEGLGYKEQLRAFRVYERGLSPELVLHIVDTPLSPEDGLLMHFLRLGTRDVVLYDPLWWQQPQNAPRGRRLLWHYRRVPATESSGERLQLLPQEHPGRIYLPRYKLWLVHRGGAELRIYTGEADSLPAEAACWSLPEERLTV